MTKEDKKSYLHNAFEEAPVFIGSFSLAQAISVGRMSTEMGNRTTAF